MNNQAKEIKTTNYNNVLVISILERIVDMNLPHAGRQIEDMVAADAMAMSIERWMAIKECNQVIDINDLCAITQYVKSWPGNFLQMTENAIIHLSLNNWYVRRQALSHAMTPAQGPCDLLKMYKKYVQLQKSDTPYIRKDKDKDDQWITGLSNFFHWVREQ